MPLQYKATKDNGEAIRIDCQDIGLLQDRKTYRRIFTIEGKRIIIDFDRAIMDRRGPEVQMALEDEELKKHGVSIVTETVKIKRRVQCR